MKDIFIDNNIAKNFANPMDTEYKILIQWLMKYDEDEDPEKVDCAFLVLSNKLLHDEYMKSSYECTELTGIQAIVNLLTEQGRINFFSNQQIKEFQKKHFTKTLETELNLKRLGKDRNHIPIVLLSNRKYAIAIDKGFRYALLNFPRFKATVVSRPEELDYK